MFARRFAVVKLAALTLLLAAGTAPVAAAQSAPVQAVDTRSSYRGNRVLTNVVIYGSIGAIVGALGTLRKRGGTEATLNEEENAGR